MSDPYSPYQPPAAHAGYSPPGVYAQQSTALPTPGIVRAAAIMMAVLGALILLGSVLIAIVIASLPIEMLEEAGALEGVPPDMDVQTAMTVGATCMGVCGGAMGLLYLVMSPFVWRGGRGPTIVSAVIAGVCVAIALLMAVLTLAQGAPQAAAGAMVWIVAAVIPGVLLALLAGSLKALRRRDLYALAAYQASLHGSYVQQSSTPPQAGSGWDQRAPR